MTDRMQWKKLILQQNHNRVRRIMSQLFIDMPRTLPYVLAIADVSTMQAHRHKITDLVQGIRRRAREIPLKQLENALEAIVACREYADCFAVIFGAYENERAASLVTLQRLTDIMDVQLNQDLSDKPSNALITITTIIETGPTGNTHTWTNFLRQSRTSGDLSTLHEIVCVFGLMSSRINVVAYSSWEKEWKVLDFSNGDDQLQILIPAPDDLVDWLDRTIDKLLRKSADKDTSLVQLAEAMRASPDAWCSAYEDMWLEMMMEPKWGLREDGLDCATITVSALHEGGYRYLQLYPLEPFPNFRALLCMKRENGKNRFVEIIVEPSDLLQIKRKAVSEDDILHWIDRILAFTALRAAWTIIMGHLSTTPKGTESSRNAGSAIVRPRFRRLPKGQTSSLEARTRSLERFRKEPLPGFTFVREYQRGMQPQSGDPLFAVSNLDVQPADAPKRQSGT